LFSFMKFSHQYRPLTIIVVDPFITLRMRRLSPFIVANLALVGPGAAGAYTAFRAVGAYRPAIAV